VKPAIGLAKESHRLCWQLIGGVINVAIIFGSLWA